MTTADYNVLTKLCILYLKYMKKYVLHNLSQLTCTMYIVYICTYCI